MNGDGFADVLIASSYESSITWWKNVDGSGTSWDEHPVDGSFNGAHCVFAEDMDGDGQMDILGAASVAGDIAWFRNEDGYGTSWTKHVITASLSGSASVYAYDIDCDGFEDVLGAAFSDDKIVWWRNEDGTGTSWTEFLVDESIDGADAARTSDIDGDGYPDVVAAASDADLVAWWRVVGYGPGALESSVLAPHMERDRLDCRRACRDVYRLSGDVFGQPWYHRHGALVGYTLRSMWSGRGSPGRRCICSVQGGSRDNGPECCAIPAGCDHKLDHHGCLGVGRGGSPGLPVAPNPCRGPTALRFCIPEPAAVELLIYDISGRMVSRREDHCPAGVNQLEVSGLAGGVYIARLYCEEMTALRRFVVLE